MSPSERTGLWHGFIAYVVWGLFPLYFIAFARSGALEVVAHRALWSLVFCLVLLAVTRTFGQVRDVVHDRRLLAGLAVAGFLIAGNWTIYIAGVVSGRTLDAALGYFINPLVVTGLGVLVLGERLRRGQQIAFGFGALAVVVLWVGYGQVPWVALGLSATFGTYSLVKKVAGRSVAPVPGLAVETAAISPIALIYLIVLGVTGHATASPLSGYGVLLATTGIVTAVPLLLFASAARRVTLVTIGMLQYLAPIGQFLIGWLVFGEPMPPARWAGFVLVWIAISVFAFDAVRAHRKR